MKVTVLLITKNQSLSDQIQEFLENKRHDEFQLKQIDQTNGSVPDSDIALLDEAALPNHNLDFLAQSTFQLSPRPIVLLLNDELVDEKAYRAVKTLAADFLLQDKLTSSSLRNTIIYALDTHKLKLQVEQQQKRYSSLFYNAVDPAFFLDDEFVITGANDAFLNVFGVSKSQALDKPFANFLETDDINEDLCRHFENFSKEVFDKKIMLKSNFNQHSFLGHMRISPLLESNYVNGRLEEKATTYHGTLKNISHESRLRAIEQKNEKIATTYKLARTLAHEIRNPLTNVNLAIDQLKEETKDLVGLEMYYDIIKRGTKRIDGLLTQLLNSSQKQDRQLRKFNGVEVFKEVIDEIEDRAKLEAVKLDIQFELDRAELVGDRERLKIAITNLFTNALESMEKEEKKLICRAGMDDDYYYMEVSDNGVGMTVDQLERLFDPFFTSKSTGIGLGLTSTQTIVAEHNGEISVDSTPGKGSTFWIYLPTAG
jgi:nitrogen-specific signal transduction histidine kinase